MSAIYKNYKLKLRYRSMSKKNKSSMPQVVQDIALFAKQSQQFI